MYKILFFILFPVFLGAQSANDYNLQGVDAIEKGDYQEAIDLFIKAIEIDEKYDHAYFNKGLANQYLELYKEAEADFLKVFKITEKDELKISALMFIAYIQRNIYKAPSDALINTNRALKIDSESWEVNYMRGLVLYDLHRFEEAEESLDKAISLNPSNPNPYYDRAIVKRNLNRYKEAVKDYSIVIKLDPTYHKAYNNRGYARSIVGDFKGAVEDYDKSIEVNERMNQMDKSSYSYNNRGYAKYKLGNYEEAKADCEKAIELDPENSWAYHYLGLIYYDSGRKDEGCKLFKKAYKMGKEDVINDIKEKCSKF